MNAPKALDLTTEWEDQCNNPIRHDRPVHEGNDPNEWAISFHQAREMHRRSRLTLKAVWCILGAIAFAVLFFTGLLVEWLALPAVLILSCIASASAGRVLEGKRR